jgi:hypothetical protein
MLDYGMLWFNPKIGRADRGDHSNQFIHACRVSGLPLQFDHIQACWIFQQDLDETTYIDTVGRYPLPVNALYYGTLDDPDCRPGWISTE